MTSFAPPWLARILAVLLGGVMVFAYAPFGHAWITLPVLLGLAFLAQHSTPRSSWQLGFSFGLGWFSTGLSWIFVSIDTFGGIPLLGTIAILALLFCYLSLFPAAILWAWRWLQVHWHSSAGYWSLPLLWFVGESLRGTFFTGFPWLDLGYSQTDSWLASYAPWFGVEGITVVLWLIVLSILWGLQKAQLKWLSIAVLLVVTAPLLHHLKPLQRTGDSARVLLVQGNIPQQIKWKADQYWPSFMRYVNLTTPHLAEHDIVVWPESAVTMPEPYTDNALQELHKTAAKSRTGLISGIIDSVQGEYFNSMIVLGQDGAEAVLEPYQHGHSNRYNKHQLLPIGEFVPFASLLRPLAPLFDLPMSSFTRGETQQANLRARGFHLTAAICYEVAFPELLRQNVHADTDFLVTVSNDTWFGASHGPAQHLQIARMRALELGRPMLRATNSGLTAIINENGREIARAEQFATTSLSAIVPVVRGATWYHRFGSWSIFWLALIIPLFVWLSIVKRSQNQ